MRLLQDHTILRLTVCLHSRATRAVLDSQGMSMLALKQAVIATQSADRTRGHVRDDARPRREAPVGVGACSRVACTSGSMGMRSSAPLQLLV